MPLYNIRFELSSLFLSGKTDSLNCKNDLRVIELSLTTGKAP